MAHLAARSTAFLALSLALLQGCKSTPPPAEAPATPAASVPSKPPAHPYTKQHIYDETTDPHLAIAAGLKRARREHKRVLVDFGGDWCGDCQVLDIYFHQAPNDQLLEKNFVLVHVFVGRMDRNLEIAEKYGIPIRKGVPAIAVLDAKGKVLYSQQTGQFEDMRHMEAQSVTSFLNDWKG